MVSDRKAEIVMTVFRPSWQHIQSACLIAFNLVVWVVVGWAAAIAIFDFPYRVGVDGQKARCLPWSVFLIDRTVPASIHVGDLIQFQAGALGYGFDGLLFVKQVGAVAGDVVEVRSDDLWINGKQYDHLWLMGTLKKRASEFDRKYVVKAGEYLMLGTSRDSFDGRYWGPIQQGQIVGSATPIY